MFSAPRSWDRWRRAVLPIGESDALRPLSGLGLRPLQGSIQIRRLLMLGVPRSSFDKPRQMALAVTLPVRDVAIPDCATVIEVGLFHTVAQIVRIARSMIAVAVQLGAFKIDEAIFDHLHRQASSVIISPVIGSICRARYAAPILPSRLSRQYA